MRRRQWRVLCVALSASAHPNSPKTWSLPIPYAHAAAPPISLQDQTALAHSGSQGRASFEFSPGITFVLYLAPLGSQSLTAPSWSPPLMTSSCGCSKTSTRRQMGLGVRILNCAVPQTSTRSRDRWEKFTLIGDLTVHFAAFS